MPVKIKTNYVAAFVNKLSKFTMITGESTGAPKIWKIGHTMALKSA
jgi:hypothetical protein